MIPSLLDCSRPVLVGDKPRSREPGLLDRHRRAAFPIPPGFRLEFLPGDTLDLNPGEEQLVTVNVVAPDGFTGQQAININAFDGRVLFGGVTLYIHS
jgi:hypothetical protein